MRLFASLHEFSKISPKQMEGAMTLTPFEQRMLVHGTEFNTFCERLKQLDEITSLQECEELASGLKDFGIRWLRTPTRNALCWTNHTIFIPEGTPIPFQESINLVRKHARTLEPLWFQQALSAPGTTLPNMPYSLFKALEQDWNNAKYKDMTKEEFWTKFDAMACTDWNKMDECGEHYSDRWHALMKDFNDDWNEIRRHNFNHLYELQLETGVSIKFILSTIRIGCNTRDESVAYTRKWIGWMKELFAKRNA